MASALVVPPPSTASLAAAAAGETVFSPSVRGSVCAAACDHRRAVLLMRTQLVSTGSPDLATLRDYLTGDWFKMLLLGNRSVLFIFLPSRGIPFFFFYSFKSYLRVKNKAKVRCPIDKLKIHILCPNCVRMFIKTEQINSVCR